jgi:hypothetical protein
MVAVVIALVAGIIGLLILKNVKDDEGSSSGPDNTSKPTTTVGGSTTSGVTTTSGVLDIRTGATVVVANASSQDGVAGQLSTLLQKRGYKTGDPVNANAKRDTTIILVKDGDVQAAAVARTLLKDMGLPGPTQSLPTPAPTKQSIGTATVLIMLGADKAGEPLEATGVSTSVAGSSTTKAATTTTGG